MKAVAFVVSALLFVGLAAGQVGNAPSGIGDRVDVGVDRSIGNWAELQVRSVSSAVLPSKSARLESQGYTRLG